MRGLDELNNIRRRRKQLITDRFIRSTLITNKIDNFELAILTDTKECSKVRAGFIGSTLVDP